MHCVRSVDRMFDKIMRTKLKQGTYRKHHRHKPTQAAFGRRNNCQASHYGCVQVFNARMHTFVQVYGEVQLSGDDRQDLPHGQPGSTISRRQLLTVKNLDHWDDASCQSSRSHQDAIRAYQEFPTSHHENEDMRVNDERDPLTSRVQSEDASTQRQGPMLMERRQLTQANRLEMGSYILAPPVLAGQSR